MALSVDKICKTFNMNHKVLDEISFHVEEGKIFGLVGLNGIGKTTTIKIMLDLLTSDSGVVKFFGRDSTDYRSREKIYYLPEKFQPSLYLTGHEFLELSMMLGKKPYDKSAAKAMAYRVDLDGDVLDKKIKSYSKGMGQKVGLLAAFLSNAPLLILDEPMSGLDPKSRIKVKEAALAYRTNGNAIFFSSHILADMDEICDTIAVLHDGKILFNGVPSKLKEETSQPSLEKAFLQLISV